MTVWRFALAALAVVLAAGCSTDARQQAMADARIESPKGRMTVEEKVGQPSPYSPMFIGQVLKPTVEGGVFDLWLGPSATQGLKTSFVLAEPE
ncbi:hypothetical protein WKW77_01155 [Variovorax ureilyticus]|uniref:Uncharacterized protein n=1 Tax=Variovorax ureilyticus TaxID=1836198 RepID=A0ABU8V8L2_9BURK